MISIKNLSYSTDKQILNSVSLKLKKGEIHGIVGVSGAGKSTLLKLIGGFLNYSEGLITFEGKKIVGPAEKMIPGYEDIQLVNQDYALDIYHTVRENIRVQAQHLTEKERDEMIEELLELFDLKSIENLKAHQISGGEQQRLALARALAKEPKVILMDEPFAHLDVHLKSRIIQYFLKLRKIRKTTLLLVTHNGSEAMAMCDTIHFLRDGEISRSAKAEDFYFHPSDYFEASFFGEINQVTRNRKKLLFRPNQYILKGEEKNELLLNFKNAVFQGFYYANYFTTNKRETVVLYAEQPLNTIQKVYLFDH